MEKIIKSNKFYLKKPPPTSAACRYHLYTAYYQVQEWLGNPGGLDVTQWGWEILDEDISVESTDCAEAPESVLRVVSGGCKVQCSKRI